MSTPPAVVNVLGLQRAGTTMLHLMLANGPEIIACGEIGGWFRVSRHRRASVPPSKFEDLCSFPACEFHARALEHFSASYIIDSTKGIDWAYDVNRWSNEQGNRVYNILIWKDPIDQVFSSWKRGGGGHLTRRYTWYHLHLQRAGFEYITVNYRDLVNNPCKKLKQICDHIDMPYFEGKERFWEADQQFVGSSPGVRNQVERGQSQIQMEPHPPSFSDVATRVKEQVNRDPRLLNVYSRLRKKEISQFEKVHSLQGHAFDPTLMNRAEHFFWSHIKPAWQRTRWNIVEPIFGEQIRKLKAIVSFQNSRRYESFDPDAES